MSIWNVNFYRVCSKNGKKFKKKKIQKKSWFFFGIFRWMKIMAELIRIFLSGWFAFLKIVKASVLVLCLLHHAIYYIFMRKKTSSWSSCCPSRTTTLSLFKGSGGETKRFYHESCSKKIKIFIHLIYLYNFIPTPWKMPGKNECESERSYATDLLERTFLLNLNELKYCLSFSEPQLPCSLRHYWIPFWSKK